MTEIWTGRAGAEDLDVVVELNSLLFREDSGRRDPFVDQSWPEREGREHFAALIRDGGLCLIVRFDGETVGYLAGYVREGGSLRPVKVAELESMYVREEHRGRGLGGRLVDEFLRWAGVRVRGGPRLPPTPPTNGRYASTGDSGSSHGACRWRSG